MKSVCSLKRACDAASIISGISVGLAELRKSDRSSDETLIRQITVGDHLAMQTLVGRHQVRLYRFLHRIVRNSTLAEDLLSDVFLEVWRQAGKFEGRSSVSTWLLAIGRFKAQAALRGQVRVVELDDAMASSFADPADNPEIVLQKKYDAERLQRCVAALPSAQADVIALIYYHGRTISEVAQIMNIPEGTVKTRMFRARKELALMLSC
jgi:RNA polymerase sigma-70 factor (ECF subfamily)